MILPLHTTNFGREIFAICPPGALLGSSADQVGDQQGIPLGQAPGGGSLRERMLAHMVTRAQVRPESYAHGLIVDLHASIFVRALDLKADYVTYFAVEYPTFAEYLRRRERLAASDVIALAAAFDRSAAIIRFEPWHAFLREKYGLTFLATLLGE